MQLEQQAVLSAWHHPLWQKPKDGTLKRPSKGSYSSITCLQFLLHTLLQSFLVSGLKVESYFIVCV